MVALVVILILFGIPVIMGMSGVACVDCDFGILVAGACAFAVLAAAVGVVLARHAVRLRVRPDLLARVLAASGLYRPPRSA